MTQHLIPITLCHDPSLPPNVPFPVIPSYIIRADLLRMPNIEKHFVFDQDYFRYIQEKINQLEHHPELCHVYANANEAALTDVTWRIFAKLAEDYPEYVKIENGVRL